MKEKNILRIRSNMVPRCEFLINSTILLSLFFGCLLSICACSKKGPKETVRIGAILPLSGDLSKYGKTSQAAIELAVDEINSDPASAYHFECVFEDDGLNASKGVSSARKLISFDKVNVLVGPLASSITLAVAPVADERKIVLLSPGSSAPGVGDAGDYIFRNCLSDSFEGIEMAKLAFSRLGIKNIGIYAINNDYGNGLSSAFISAFEEAGGQVVADKRFDQGSRQHQVSLTQLENVNPDAIYLIGYDEMVSVFQQATELGIHRQWLACSFLNDEHLVKQTKGAADGAILAAWSYDPSSNNPRIKLFVDAIRKTTGGLEVDVFAANSYDAIYLIHEGLKYVDGDVKRLAQGLHKIDSYSGITGKTTFEKNGDVRKELLFKKISNGELINYP